MQLENTAQVWGISGNLGGGKTLSGVEIAVTAMASGFYVVSNIELNMDAICRDYGPQMASLYSRIDLESSSPDSWPCGSPRGSGGRKRVLVILDEVAEWFDQFSATSASVRSFLSWLRHSSKRGQDVFLIVQRREYLAKSLRILISRWIWVDDLAVFRLPRLRMRLPFCSGLCYRSYFDRLGNSVQPGNSIRKAKWGQYYNTAQCLSTVLGTPYEYTPPDAPPPRPFAWDALLPVVLLLAVLALA